MGTPGGLGGLHTSWRWPPGKLLLPSCRWGDWGLETEIGCKGRTSNEQRGQGTSQHPSDSRALPNPQQGLSRQPCNRPVSHQEWISKIEASCRKSGCQATNMTQCVKRETVHLTTIPWAYISRLIFTYSCVSTGLPDQLEEQQAWQMFSPLNWPMIWL